MVKRLALRKRKHIARRVLSVRRAAKKRTQCGGGVGCDHKTKQNKKERRWLGATKGHAAAVSGDGSGSRKEENSRYCARMEAAVRMASVDHQDAPQYKRRNGSTRNVES